MPALPWAALLPAESGGKPAAVASTVICFRKRRRSARCASMSTSSLPHSTRDRPLLLREAQGRVPELQEILRAHRDAALHLGLGGHDVEAILTDPVHDLLGHFRGWVAPGEPVGERLPEGLRHRSRLALLGELRRTIARRAHDVRVDEAGTDHGDAD